MEGKMFGAGPMNSLVTPATMPKKKKKKSMMNDPGKKPVITKPKIKSTMPKIKKPKR